MPRTVMDIFLSSTSKDLVAYRAKVREMVDRMRQVSIAMETFGADPRLPFEKCRQMVQKSDALIVVVGHRYGWLPSREAGGDGRRSITWWEVQWALDGKKPVFAFVLDPQAPWTGEREQDRLLTATTQAQMVEIGQAVEALREFRRFLDDNTTRELFSSADDLAAKVATGLHPWILEHALRAAGTGAPAPGGEKITIGGPSAGPNVPGAASVDASALYYAYEQIHAQSALALVPRSSPVRLALISGRADTSHPALAGASIQQVNVSGRRGPAAPDDYTTAIAGLLVGSDPAGGYRGVSPGTELLVLGILEQNYAASRDAISRALDAARIDGVDAVCVPLGVPSGSATEHAAIKAAVDAGITVICPAGNEPGKVNYPGAYPEAVGVAAVTSKGTLAEFSGRGAPVALAAPGQDITVPVGNDSYRNWTGTAFSCAIAAGVVALMRRAAPDLSPGRIEEILRSTATPLGSSFSPNGGLVNAFLAVQEALRPASRGRNRPGGSGKSRTTGKRKSPTGDSASRGGRR
jgi:hypothetical protein